MAFWQRVDIEDRTPSQSSTGAEVLAWAPALTDVEARLLPLAHSEEDMQWATPEEEAFRVQLRGQQAVEPTMRLLADGIYYDVRKVTQPPPFGTPVTVLYAVKVTP